jgi:hypothetical protein
MVTAKTILDFPLPIFDSGAPAFSPPTASGLRADRKSAT